MKICNKCETTLWTSDRGCCPVCDPVGCAKAHGLKPFPPKEPIQEKPLLKPAMKAAEPVNYSHINTLSEAVQYHITKVYAESERNKAKTAKRLDISIKTLYNHLEKYGIR